MKCLKVSSKGQIVLPAKIRKQLNIGKGSRFKIEVQGSKIILTPINREFFEKVAGSFSTNGKLLKTLIAERKKEKYL